MDQPSCGTALLLDSAASPVLRRLVRQELLALGEIASTSARLMPACNNGAGRNRAEDQPPWTRNCGIW